MRIRAWALCGAAGLFLAGQALADDLTVDKTLTAPISTSDPAGNGGTPGDITFAGGGVNITSAGAAVTLDSNNTITNNGSILNGATSGGIGIHIEGGFTGDVTDSSGRIIGLTGTGAITAAPTTLDATSTGSIGILIDGAGNFTGDIDLHAMTIGASSCGAPACTGSGPGAVGLEIDTGVVGNVTVGNITATGQGASAVRTTAAIDGVLSFTGTLASEGVSATSITDPDPTGGAVVAIGGDVSDGILVVGPLTASDTTTIPASINQVVTGDVRTGPVNAPAALEISPSIGGSGAPSLTIGILNDATNPGFSFINRGGIHTVGADPGVNVTAIYIGREDGDAGSHTATLTGGIFNQSDITAAATSANANATTIDPTTVNTSADATAIHIAAGGSLPTIVNDAGATIQAATSGPRGGTAVGVLIDAGGSLTSFVNNGAMSASATTTDTTIADPVRSVVIWDKSGTLTSFTNTGAITTTATTLDDGHQVQLAGDFSANTTTMTFTNSGTLQGDIVFGSGTNQLIIDGDTATATGNYHATGAGQLDINLVNGTLTTASTQGHDLQVGAHGSLAMTLAGTSNSTPVISLSGNGNFAAGSHIAFTYANFMGDSASFALVHADGTLAFADLAGATSDAKPFLYNTTIANDGNDLTLQLQRKTATELGFTGNVARVYEPAIAAVLEKPDTALGVALMNLTDAQSTTTAFQSLVPTINGAQRNYAIQLTDMSFGPVGARQREIISSPNQGRSLSFWGQEFYLANQNDGTPGIPGYSDSGVGVAAGADYGSLSTGRYGVAFEHFNGDSIEGDPRVTKTVNNWTVFSLYADWEDSDTGLFFGTQGTAGIGSFDEKRRILVGDYTPEVYGHWTGWLVAWGASVGDVIGNDTFAIIPQADIDALYMSEGAYHEHSGGAADLAIGARSGTSLRSFIGLVGRANIPFEGGYVRPEIHLGWTNEFTGHPADANVYFISAQDMHFHISGPAEPPSRLVGGGSLSFVYNNWSVGGDYDRTFGSNSLTDAGSVTVTGHF